MTKRGKMKASAEHIRKLTEFNRTPMGSPRWDQLNVELYGHDPAENCLEESPETGHFAHDA